MALVGSCQTAGRSFAQREFGLRSIQRLNACLLVHAQDNSIVRRVEVEPDDVNHFSFEFGIARLSTPVFGLVRLKSRIAQSLMLGGLADAVDPCNAPLAPGGRTVRRL